MVGYLFFGLPSGGKFIGEKLTVKSPPHLFQAPSYNLFHVKMSIGQSSIDGRY